MTHDPTRINLITDPLRERIRGVALHGTTSFDVPYISEIADNLYQGGCVDELVLPTFIMHVVSLYPWESYDVGHELLSRLEVTQYDGGVVPAAQIDALADWVNVCRTTGPVLVHCQAGLNRSSVVVARALMRGPEQMSADDAIYQIRRRRSTACLCNKTFERWVREHD